MLFPKKLIIKCIENSESRKEMEKFSLLEAIRLMAESWNCVTAKIIQNCYKKSGISKNNLLLETLVDNEETDIFSDLLTVNSNWNIEFDEYDDIDNQVIVAEYPTDEEIFNRNKNKQLLILQYVRKFE